MCRPVHHEVDLPATPRDVFDAYLDSRRHARITGGPAKMGRREGERFSAGDYISGFNLEIVPARRIVQAWRGSDWPEGEYSILRLELRPRGKGCRLVVDHIGIPEAFREGVDEGWYQFYWEPMQRYFGEAPEKPRARA